MQSHEILSIISGTANFITIGTFEIFRKVKKKKHTFRKNFDVRLNFETVLLQGRKMLTPPNTNHQYNPLNEFKRLINFQSIKYQIVD